LLAGALIILILLDTDNTRIDVSVSYRYVGRSCRSSRPLCITIYFNKWYRYRSTAQKG